MKQSCPKCHTIVEINEKEYRPGEKVNRQCPLCDNILTFDIPKEEKKEVVVKEVESEEAKKRIAELEKKVAELEKAKKEPQLARQSTQVSSQPAPRQQQPLPPKVTTPPQRPITPTPKPITPIPIKKRRTGTIIFFILIGILLAIAGTVFGIFYHNNIYLPKKIDREAPRYYVIGQPNLALRSTCFIDNDKSRKKYNEVTRADYGTELIYYGDKYNPPVKKVYKMYNVPYLEPDWCFVKIAHPYSNDQKQPGCAKTEYLLNTQDFILLSSIWGNAGCDTIIKYTTAYEKKVLMNHVKNLPNVNTRDEGNKIDNPWQIYSNGVRPKDNGPDAFKKREGLKTIDGQKFSFFAVIITNDITKEYRCILYTIQDDSATLRVDQPVDYPYIETVTYNKNYDYFDIDYAY